MKFIKFTSEAISEQLVLHICLPASIHGAKHSPCMLRLGWPSADFSDSLPDLKSRPLRRHNFESPRQRMEQKKVLLKTY